MLCADMLYLYMCVAATENKCFHFLGSFTEKGSNLCILMHVCGSVCMYGSLKLAHLAKNSRWVDEFINMVGFWPILLKCFHFLGSFTEKGSALCILMHVCGSACMYGLLELAHLAKIVGGWINSLIWSGFGLFSFKNSGMKTVHNLTVTLQTRFPEWMLFIVCTCIWLKSPMDVSGLIVCLSKNHVFGGT